MPFAVCPKCGKQFHLHVTNVPAWYEQFHPTKQPGDLIEEICFYCHRELEPAQQINPAPIESLVNLGPQSAAWIREAGITTIGELEHLGPTVVFRIVKQRQPKASMNLLWALAAGIQGRDWRELGDAEKENLRKELADD